MTTFPGISKLEVTQLRISNLGELENLHYYMYVTAHMRVSYRILKVLFFFSPPSQTPFYDIKKGNPIIVY